MPRTVNCHLDVAVEIVVNDESAITRVLENHDENGVSQPDVRGGTGWRNVLYDLRDEDAVIEMWAYNAVVNGVTRASQLDGWGDMDDDAVTMRVHDAQVDWWEEKVNS